MFECLLEEMQESCQNDNALIMSKHLKFICPLSDTQVFISEHSAFRFAHTSCLRCFTTAYTYNTHNVRVCHTPKAII